ncbi:hypothetical protein HAX54_031744 [Datura stramonium]|uniref:Uncharacterized protein n=1 Tax=Datura stramonium TaxID=4076 RepID=A0ABS8SC25_DATST|nr:hypothetical protein [Datura stramonium]
MSVKSLDVANVYIANRGIPVLVGFLEADYAKYRKWFIHGYRWHVADRNAPYGTDQPDMLKFKNGDRFLPSEMQELFTYSQLHIHQILHFLDTGLVRDLGQQRGGNTSRISTDRTSKQIEGASYGFPASTATQQENVRPLLSLLEKEPPSRHFSGQLEYHNLPGLEKHESILPLHAFNEKKTNGLILMAEFAEVSGREGKILMWNHCLEVHIKLSLRKKCSIIWNTHTHGSLNADVAREYLEKVADLLLEFAAADTTVKSFMCSQSLLSRLFQMFNKIEPPILLKLLKCINHLSTDPHCLEHLQRADAIKYLIPTLISKRVPLWPKYIMRFSMRLFNLCKINKRRQEQAGRKWNYSTLDAFYHDQFSIETICIASSM